MPEWRPGVLAVGTVVLAVAEIDQPTTAFGVPFCLSTAEMTHTPIGAASSMPVNV
jgi:hypothetical protein